MGYGHHKAGAVFVSSSPFLSEYTISIMVACICLGEELRNPHFHESGLGKPSSNSLQKIMN